MIICRTPLRISFFGGGTDLPSFFEKEFGCTISTSIGNYVHLVGHRSFDNSYKVHYNEIELTKTIDEIKNTRVRAALNRIPINKGIEIYSIAEVPHGTGLGSSSSFAVGMVNLLNAMKGDVLSKEELSRIACEIELNDLNEPIGKQDQNAASHGGFNYIQYNTDGSTVVSSLNLEKDLLKKLEERIVVFYLDKTRSASKILEEQRHNITSQKEKFKTLQNMKKMTLKIREDLESGNIENFGKMLHESWMMKRSLTDSISDPFIDEIYEKGLLAGASGGKVLGAGGGGFILFYCEPEYQKKLRKSLLGLKEFKIEFENKGSQIVYKC